MDVKKINKERFSKWIHHFNKENATVQFSIGVTHGAQAGRLVVTTTEELPKDHIIAMLHRALIECGESDL